MMAKNKYLIAAFISGMATMGVEMTASRLLAPYFGASLFVWTSLIVTVLLAMSFGYWFGGRIAKNADPERVLGLIYGAAGAIIGLSSWIVSLLSPRVSTLVFGGGGSAAVALFAGSFAVSFAVFALPVFMLAAAAPLLMAGIAKHDDVGHASGTYFLVSTLGSVVGTVAPGLLLVPFLGSRLTLLAFAAALLLLGFTISLRRDKMLAIFIALPALSGFAAHVPADAHVLYSGESPYQHIRVETKDGANRLLFNEGLGVQSVYDPSGKISEYFYFDAFAVVPFIAGAADRPHDVAIIGMAGGSAARSYQAGIPSGLAAITGVEIDPQVTELARKYFALDQTGATTVNEDGRIFLARSEKTYDVIIADAYSVQLYIPSHLATKEFFALAKSRLKPGGVFVMNIAAANFKSPLLVAVANSVAASFPNVKIAKMPGSWNHLLFASDQPLDLTAADEQLPAAYNPVIGAMHNAVTFDFDAKKPVFTDDKAPVEFYTDTMVVEAVF